MKEIIKKKLNEKGKILDWTLVFNRSSYNFNGSKYYYRDFAAFEGVRGRFLTSNREVTSFFISWKKFSEKEFQKLKKREKAEKLLFFE